MAIFERFRTLLEQQRDHRPDRWECAVLERVLIALRLGGRSAGPGDGESWHLLAESYLDFYERERSRSPRAMEHMAAAERPISAFIDELDQIFRDRR